MGAIIQDDKDILKQCYEASFLAGQCRSQGEERRCFGPQYVQWVDRRPLRGAIYPYRLHEEK